MAKRPTVEMGGKRIRNTERGQRRCMENDIDKPVAVIHRRLLLDARLSGPIQDF